MLEQPGLHNCLHQPIPILDMTCIVTDPRIKNIAQSILSQKQVTQHPHTFGIVVVQPHTA